MNPITFGPLQVSFDDEHAVADAGLVLPATLGQRLGLEQAADELVGVGYRPGRKTATLVHALLAGADCIDDADLLRAGTTGRILGHDVVAPSTLGTWLREFTFGHVRQLDRLTETLLTRAWSMGAGPGTASWSSTWTPRSLRSTATPSRAPATATPSATTPARDPRRHRRGPPHPHAQGLGEHRTRCPAVRPRDHRPDPPSRRHRTDHLAGGLGVLVEQDHQRVPRPPGAVLDTVRQTAQVRDTITAIPESAWVDIAYPAGGQAQVAATRLGDHRLIVRRTRLVGARQEALFPDWRHHAFVTDQTGSPVDLDAGHRHHAVVELAIRDLKEGPG